MRQKLFSSCPEASEEEIFPFVEDELNRVILSSNFGILLPHLVNSELFLFESNVVFETKFSFFVEHWLVKLDLSWA